MIIEVDTAGPVPPYEQIRAQLATMIATRALRIGDRLPTVRQLAADLGLAVNTVARAYRELEAEGLVISRVRHGTTVATHRREMSRAEVRRRLEGAARAYALTARQLGASDVDALAAVRAAVRAATPADNPDGSSNR